MKRLIQVCLVAGLFLNATDVEAQKAKELIPLADSYVFMSKKNENFGAENKILVRRLPGKIHNAFIKFDISGLEPAVIKKAGLRLYCIDLEDSSISTTIDLFSTEDVDWTESSLNYTNAPKPVKKQGSVTIDKKDTYYEWDVTHAVNQSKSAGTKYITFRLSDQKGTGNGIQFNSKEAANNKPQLTIE